MPKPSPEKSRGRPAKLSREQILNCAMKMIERSPGQKITMTGVAKALKTAPMSLYTHVEHRDDLMDGLSGMVMGQLVIELLPQDTWEQQVRHWMLAVYEHLSAYPQIVELLPQSDKTPVDWLRVHASLIETLHTAGLRGERLANTSQWIAHQVIGALVMGFARQKHDNSSQPETLAQLSDKHQQLFAEITPYLLPDNGLFPFTVDQVIRALRAEISSHG